MLEKVRIAKNQNNKESPKNLVITAVLIYNQSIHSYPGYTPFSLLYGPYDNLNAYEIDLNKTVYESYNVKQKREVMPFMNKYTKSKQKMGQEPLRNAT